jgi:ferritin-like metal-binding protein YciE
MAKQTHGRNETKRQNGPAPRRRVQPGNGSEGEGTEMADNPLHALFLEELADLYNAEEQLTKALPKMSKAAKSEELRQAFDDHLQETEDQVVRLEELFGSLGESVRQKKCKGMQGLLDEAAQMLQEHKDKPTIDAVLIANAQKAEHYEISTYGTLAEWARQMGHSEAVELLQQNLEEEKAADEKLTEIATSLANAKAED